MESKDTFGYLFKKFENLTNKDFEKRIEINKRETEQRTKEKNW